MVRLNVKRRGSACSGSIELPVVRVIGLQLGHGVRPWCLCVGQVTQFAKASCV